MTKKQSDTLSDQSINTALLVSTFTADQDYPALRINEFIDNIVGNGDYSIYVTHQKAGAGTAYKSAITTDEVASGVTNHRFSTLTLAIEDEDVVKVYLLGLASDNVSAVDIITEWWYEPWENVDAKISDVILTNASTAAASGVDGVNLTLTNRLTFAETIEDLTIPVSWAEAYLTVKKEAKDADAISILQIKVTNGGHADDGILYVNKVAASAAEQAYGSLTVDQGAGKVAVSVYDDLVFLDALMGNWFFDIKFIETGPPSTSTKPARSAHFSIQNTETHAI